jgi:hypothetical protein
MIARAIQPSKTSTLSKCFESPVDLALVDIPLEDSPPLALVQIHPIESFLILSSPADWPLIELLLLGS